MSSSKQSFNIGASSIGVNIVPSDHLIVIMSGPKSVRPGYYSRSVPGGKPITHGTGDRFTCSFAIADSFKAASLHSCGGTPDSLSLLVCGIL